MTYVEAHHSVFTRPELGALLNETFDIYEDTRYVGSCFSVVVLGSSFLNVFRHCFIAKLVVNQTTTF